MNKFIALTALTASMVDTKIMNTLRPMVGAAVELKKVLDNYDGHVIELKPDMRITFEMHENEDGGFEWEIIEDTCETRLKVVLDDFVVPQTTDTTVDGEEEWDSGAEGIRTWVMQTPSESRSLKAGLQWEGKTACDVKMVFKEAWEAPAPTDKYLTINFMY